MREDFVDPLPKMRLPATLLFGRSPVDCYIVEEFENGFRVAVPNVERYEGDPRLTLATEEDAYPVRIVLQERHAGGYSYVLELREEDLSLIGKEGNSGILGSLSFPLAISAAVVVACICSSSFHRGMPWSNSPESSLNSLAAKQSEQPKTQSKSVAKPQTPSEAVDHDVRHVSVSRNSMIAPASLTLAVPRLLPYSETNEAAALGNDRSRTNRRSPIDGKRRLSLRSMLSEGKTGRMQIVSSATFPWLFSNNGNDPVGTFRVSDAAYFDLEQFENGLNGLPKKESEAAIASLRHALAYLNSNEAKAHRVNGFADIYVVGSDDANIYFRTVQGHRELVRVLPAE